jgi:hypothetical protein
MLLLVLLDGEPQSGVIWYEIFRQSPYSSTSSTLQTVVNGMFLAREWPRMIAVNR